MQNQFYQPHPLLQPYVQTYVYANTDDWQVDETHQLDFAPVGKTMLAFLLEEPSYLVNEKNGKQQIRFNFNGQLDQHQVLITRKMSLVYVIFQPFGAYRLFNIPQYLLKNDCVDIEDLLGSITQNIKSQLIDHSHDIPMVLHLLEKWLLKQLDKHRKIDSFDIQHVCQIIQANKGVQPISELYKTCYMSKSKIETLFRNHVGLSAKTYSRIVRFNAINQRLQQSVSIDWMAVIEQFGYTDQAHFIKDFKHFCGYTPQQKVAQKPFLSESIPLE